MRDRLPEIEALRGAAIVAVVGLHVSFGFLRVTPAASSVAPWLLAIHMLTSFGTPLFVALSMTGLALRYGPPRDAADYGAFLARRARRVVPAYAFWTVLTLLRDHPAELAAPTELARRLATGSAAYHLYFVPLICEYYLAWPLLARLAGMARRGTGAAMGLAGSGLVVTLLVWRAASIGALADRPLLLPLFWIGYATLGIAAAPGFADGRVTRLHRSRWWAVGAPLVVATALVMVRHVHAVLGPAPDAPTLVMATTIFQPTVMAYTVAAMGLATLAVAAGRPARTLAALGRASYGVYLAHVLVLEVVVQRLLGRPETIVGAWTTPLPKLVATWALALLFTFALVRVMATVPVLAPFAGGPPTDRALTPPAPTP